jgi:hypothetical protein
MIHSFERATTNLRYHQNPVLIPAHYGLTVSNVHTNSVLEVHASENVDDQSQGCTAVPLPIRALWPDPVFVAPVVEPADNYGCCCCCDTGGVEDEVCCKAGGGPVNPEFADADTGAPGPACTGV